MQAEVLADPLQVACPTCKAGVGRRCLRPSGHPLFGKESHASRWRAIGATPPPSTPRREGRIPDNVLVIPFEQEPEEPEQADLEPIQIPPLAVPHDPPSLDVGRSLLDYAPLPEPLYRTPLGQMLVGDSLALMAKLEPESVDLCLTSPPYALLRQKDYGNQDAEAYVAWFTPFVHRIRRLLKPSGFFALNLGPAWERGQPTQSLYDVRTCLMVAERLHLLYDGIWHKPGTMPGPAQWVTIERCRLTAATEHVWVFSKDPDALDKLPEGVALDSFLQFPNKDSNSEYHRRCRASGVKQHPARFPPALARYFVEHLTAPGALVLDPFAGSNTTGAVAEAAGRRWTSIELHRGYARDSWLRFNSTPL